MSHRDLGFLPCERFVRAGYSKEFFFSVFCLLREESRLQL